MIDQKDFDVIYQANYQRVFAFVYNITLDCQLAEDLVQETFLRAYANLDSYREEAKIHVWLNKIAYNLFIDYKRKKILPVKDLAEQVVNAIKTFDLQQVIEQQIMSECVQSKIQLLRENYRAVLILDMNGYSNQEIQEILACSLDNVKVRLHRARKKLKEILDQDCNFYYDQRNVLC